jgi:hypothetical protein
MTTDAEVGRGPSVDSEPVISGAELPESDGLEADREKTEEQRQLVQYMERVLTIRRERAVLNKAKAEKVRLDSDALAEARDSLATWLQDRSSSLALLLIDHLDRQDAKLIADEFRVAAWAAAPVPDLSGSARNLRRVFVRTLWLCLAIAFGVPIALYALSSYLESKGVTIPWLESTAWKYLLLGLILLVIGAFLALLAYHRGYTNLRGELARRMETGRFLLGSIDLLRRERARIDGISPQLRERLRFFGAVLQEPYRVPGFRAGEAEGSRIAEDLPALLQLASARPGQSDQGETIRSLVVGRSLKVGMRRKAVEELLVAAAISRGIPAAQADMRSIDSDVAAIGLRSAIVELVRDVSVLEEVGRRRVTEIAASMQEDLDYSDPLTPKPDEYSRPLIQRTNIDDLAGMQVKQDLLAQWQVDMQSWDEFMVEILEDGSALSKLAFSSQGLANSKHLKFDSVACVPGRLKARAGSLVSVLDLEGETIRNAEIVARLDITAPMDVSNVAVFSEAARAESQTVGGTGRPNQLPGASTGENVLG